MPNMLLRLEALALMLCSLGLYANLHGRWLIFAAMLFVPDLSMLAFAAGPRVGSYAYNAVHTLVAPAILSVVLLFRSPHPQSLLIPCIWFAHIGLDRMLGYGLKYPSAFKDTHLQRV